MTIAERHQNILRQYDAEHGHVPGSAKAVAEWAYRRGLIELPTVDPLNVLADQMARSFREEIATDPRGRRYRTNHAVRLTRNGAQTTFWGILGFAPPEHMEMAFTQRREQIIGDCFQLKTDVDVYNGMNSDRKPLELVFDFTEDIAEREAGADLVLA